MDKTNFFELIYKKDIEFINKNNIEFIMPSYKPETHYLDVANSKYYKALIVFRDSIKQACDFYWSQLEHAYNLDLFMMTPSVSSPMGPGSDSEAVEIKFGGLRTFLVDSSQFGFEPVILNGIDKVYCYLPSMRGENPDKRHLNQFYHCEAEIRGTLNELMPSMEGFIKFLADTCLHMPNILKLISENPDLSFEYLKNIVEAKNFEEVEFSEAVNILITNGFSKHINKTKYGSDISSEGELQLMKILKSSKPIWLRNFDRDRVAFYQKPIELGSNKVINADLLFPQIIDGSFWGEIIGSGQRQDNYNEMLDSLSRQKIDPAPYEWYMQLRNQSNYSITSGFGLGVERFIAWCLCKSDIKDVILYPRIKNIVTYP